MSAVTTLDVFNSAGLSKTLTPVYVDSDKVQYADLTEGNLPSRMTAELSIRRAVKPGENYKTTIKLFQPIGSLAVDPVTGATAQPYMTTTVQVICPTSSTVDERNIAHLNLSGLRFKSDGTSIETDVRSLVRDLALPY
jgi:hypothetical protein